MKKLIIVLVSLIYAVSLSGCIPLALGAAGGAYYENRHNAGKEDDDSQDNKAQASDNDQASDTDQASDDDSD